ncbi:MAG: DUF559 domain-containing protein [Candidatus Longimicrobiales bacterium M2_2A_002]
MQELAAGRHGVVTWSELAERGVARHVLENRLRSGWVRRLHRGVYGVGPAARPLEPEMAAVLACGPTAVVSYGSAALRHRLLPARTTTADEVVEVTIRRGNRSHPALRVHRHPDLSAAEVTALEGIPFTTRARTVLDLAAVLGARDLERVVATALRLDPEVLARLLALIERHPRHSGLGLLRTMLDSPDQLAFTRSEAERVFLELIRGYELPAPRVNTIVRGLEVDFFWPVHRLIVEIDGFAYHSSPAALDRDHDRDAALRTAGYTVLRFTWRQVTAGRKKTVIRLAQALALRP